MNPPDVLFFAVVLLADFGVSFIAGFLPLRGVMGMTLMLGIRPVAASSKPIGRWQDEPGSRLRRLVHVARAALAGRRALTCPASVVMARRSRSLSCDLVIVIREPGKLCVSGHRRCSPLG